MPRLLLVWVDRVRLAFAALAPAICEGYVPAQHNTKWHGLVSVWQAECHDLAAAGVRRACHASYPFPDELAGLALLFRNGRLVVHLGHTLDSLQLEALPVPDGVIPSSLKSKPQLHYWVDLVVGCHLPASALRFCFWMRSARLMLWTEEKGLRCPFCRQWCFSWGEHALFNCMVLAGAALFAFQDVYSFLHSMGFEPQWVDTITIQCLHPRLWTLQLRHDGATVVGTSEVLLTWSGLCWVGSGVEDLFRRPQCSALVYRYLLHIGHWLETDPVQCQLVAASFLFFSF